MKTDEEEDTVNLLHSTVAFLADDDNLVKQRQIQL